MHTRRFFNGSYSWRHVTSATIIADLCVSPFSCHSFTRFGALPPGAGCADRRDLLRCGRTTLLPPRACSLLCGNCLMGTQSHLALSCLLLT